MWCTAASGWSKSARNTFIAPWLRGATALLHDQRFDPAQRLELLAAERVNVLCMAPTEYRVIAKRVEIRPLPRAAVAGGRRRGAQPRGDPHVPRGDRPRDPRRLRPDRDRAADRQPAGEPVRPGSMGRPLPGVDLRVDDGELVLADPATDPTFFVALSRRRRARRPTAVATPATASARTRTATCTSRGGPTT